MKDKRSLPVCVAVGLLVAVGVAQSAERVETIQAEYEIPEDLLLDVGIRVFDPGTGDQDGQELEEKGIFQDVRRSEARYIPFQLKHTLESTGQWGAVRVVPVDSDSVDVTITGEILKSSGYEMGLKIRITDASGRVWRKDTYNEDAYTVSYDPGSLERRDPFQNVYNRIANDMLVARERLEVGDLRTIRELSRLRFGADIAPHAFADYLSVDRKGRYTIEKLPSEDDPMMQRIALIRERDYMFVDTLNEYYSDFYARMDEPYHDWRVFSYEEESALREIRRKARKRKILGGLLIFAGIVADDSSSVGRVAKDAAVIGGLATVQSGINKSKESKIHKAAIEELAASFDSEMAPLLVQVEGQTLKLEGTAEDQFAEWRRLLAELFRAETGLPVDSDEVEPVDPNAASTEPHPSYPG